ncbi:MAG: DUF4886 domain-containing protein [Phascolarctobacterium sp.]|nr:DUF4886 domain-containing protein [Candidatus Phascolarctobacterium caballi]
MFDLVCGLKHINVEKRERLTKGSNGIIVSFSFGQDWQNLSKTVIFKYGANQKDVILTEASVTIPWECLQNVGDEIIIGIYGSNAEGTIAIPTLYAKLGEVVEGADPSGDESYEATKDVVAQVIALASDAKQLSQEAKSKVDTIDGAVNESAENARIAAENAVKAASDANGAKQTADDAKRLAQLAQSAASNAQTTANAANGVAIAANDKVNSIDVKVSGISTQASTAYQLAADAKNVADGSNALAQDAKNVADGAKAKADEVYTAYKNGELKGDKGADGKDGYSPVKGVDYFTPAEVDAFKTAVTPVKGKDYFDGRDGVDGHTPTESEIKAVIQPELSSLNEDIATLEGENTKNLDTLFAEVGIKRTKISTSNKAGNVKTIDSIYLNEGVSYRFEYDIEKPISGIVYVYIKDATGTVLNGNIASGKTRIILTYSPVSDGTYTTTFQVSSSEAVKITCTIEQSNAPLEIIKEDVSDVKNSFLEKIENFTRNKIVNTHGGLYVDCSNGNVVQAVNANFDSKIVECKKGDAFIIFGKGGSGDARLYGFVGKILTSDTSKDIVVCPSTESANGKNYEVIYAPEFSNFVFFNFSNNQDYKVLKIKNNIADKTENLIANTSNVTISKTMYEKDLEWASRTAYITDDGRKSEVGINVKASDYVDVSEYDAIVFTALTRESATAVTGCVITDENHKTLTTFGFPNTKDGYTTYYYRIPKNAKYAGFTAWYDGKFKLTCLKFADNYLESETNESRHIRFLVFGNSYGCDSMSYVPFILKNLGITCEIYLYSRDGCSLRDLYNRWETDSATDTETDGIHSGTYARNVYHIDTRYMKGWAQDKRVSMKTCLEYGNWDFISLQQYSAYSVDESTYEPWLSLDIDLIRQSVDKATKLAWNGVCTRASADDKEGGLSALVNCIKKKQPFDFIIPYGTAIFNARTNETLSALGDYTTHNLWCSDGVHLQDGIGRYIASLTVAESICREFFPTKCVMYDKTRPTTEKMAEWKNPQQHLPVVGINEDNCLLAQKSAILACNNPFEITTIESLPVAPPRP